MWCAANNSSDHQPVIVPRFAATTCPTLASFPLLCFPQALPWPYHATLRWPRRLEVPVQDCRCRLLLWVAEYPPAVGWARYGLSDGRGTQQVLQPCAASAPVYSHQKHETPLWAVLCSSSKGVMVGIELDTASGKNDGTVKGVEYFSCPAKHGIMARPKDLYSPHATKSLRPTPPRQPRRGKTSPRRGTGVGGLSTQGSSTMRQRRSISTAPGHGGAGSPLAHIQEARAQCARVPLVAYTTPEAPRRHAPPSRYGSPPVWAVRGYVSPTKAGGTGVGTVPAALAAAGSNTASPAAQPHANPAPNGPREPNSWLPVTPDGGVRKALLAAGDGRTGPPPRDATVRLHYVSRSSDTGEVLRSSGAPGATNLQQAEATGSPVTVSLATDNVIQGWRVALATMRVGESATVSCDAAYATGRQGLPSMLLDAGASTFDIKLVSWEPPSPHGSKQSTGHSRGGGPADGGVGGSTQVQEIGAGSQPGRACVQAAALACVLYFGVALCMLLLLRLHPGPHPLGADTPT